MTNEQKLSFPYDMKIYSHIICLSGRRIIHKRDESLIRKKLDMLISCTIYTQTYNNKKRNEQIFRF